jgi:Fungal specific transcription factor domain
MTSGVILPDHLAWSVFLSASHFSNDPRLHTGAYSRLQIEKALKLSTDRDLNTGQSTDLSLIQALILSQLFPAWRERKVALLSWTINGRAIKLALRRQLNCNPAKLGIHDGPTARARIKTWWCVYMVDIWDAARRGRPPSIHEPDTNVPLPDIEQDTTEERFFLHLVQLTRILAQVLSFSFNNCKSAATLQSPDTTTEEAVQAFRTQLSDWFRAQTPLPPLLQSNLQIAYLTICILLHRPLLPTPLATAYADPIVLLLTKCATQIIHLAHQNGTHDAGSVPWRLFVPAVGYLTAGVTLAQNAAWSTHVQGAQPLRLAALFEITRLLDVFEKADMRGHSTAGMSSMLRSIFQRGGISLTAPPPDVRPEIELGVPLPHEDSSFTIVHSRVLAEKALSEKRTSGSVLQPIAPSLTDSSLVRKRKFDTVASSSHSSSGRGPPQPLPSLANLTGLDTGGRSPTSRSVHSHSTYSSHSSTSQSRIGQLYPHSSVPPKMPVSTAYHPTYGTTVDVRHGSRQWEQKGLMSPPPSLPPLYERRYQEPVPPKHNFPPEREYNVPPQQSYNRRDSEYYQRPISPTTRPPYPPLQQQPDPTTFHGRHPPPIDLRYARTSTPPSSVSGGTVHGWPQGYPYASPQSATYRYDHPPPTSVAPSPRIVAGPSGQQRYNEYYYPPPRE